MKLLRITALLAVLPLCLFVGFIMGGLALCVFVSLGFWEMAND